MTQQAKLKEKEVRWARAFLHALHGNEQNGYLLFAIIAWMRGEAGPWSKNNPLGLKAGNRLMSFPSYTASAQYAAKRLLAKGKDDYRLIVRKLQATPVKEALQIEQARNFLYSLALSSWDPQHYGMLQQVYDYNIHAYRTSLDPAAVDKNRLLAIWYALTGTHIPKDWFVDQVRTAPAKKRPSQPDSHAGGVPRAEYLDPYAAQRFYEARRHAADDLLVG